MVFIETIVALAVAGLLGFGVFHAFGSTIKRHEKLVVAGGVIIMFCLFLFGILANGGSFTGTNLHPLPPPAPTFAP